MRTETEITADIVALTAECNNLATVAPSLSGTSRSLQDSRQKLSDAWKELAVSRGSDPTVDVNAEPVAELAGATTTGGSDWSSKKWKKK